MCHHTWLAFYFLMTYSVFLFVFFKFGFSFGGGMCVYMCVAEDQPRASAILSMHSTIQALPQPLMTSSFASLAEPIYSLLFEKTGVGNQILYNFFKGKN
jgi:hypothetical protein